MSLTVSQHSHPIRVTGTTTEDQTIFAGKAFLRYVYWFKPTTAGDLCTIKDSDGNFIIEMRAEADNQSERFPIEYTVNGIHCDDMDSGTLYLFIL